MNGSMEAGRDAVIVLAVDSTELWVGETARSLEGLGVPPMRERLEKARARGVPVFV